MKKFLLKGSSDRHWYHGWALTMNGHILDWTVSTTRKEVREVKRELLGTNKGVQGSLALRIKYTIIKIKITVEEV